MEHPNRQISSDIVIYGDGDELIEPATKADLAKLAGEIALLREDVQTMTRTFEELGTQFESAINGLMDGPLGKMMGKMMGRAKDDGED